MKKTFLFLPFLLLIACSSSKTEDGSVSLANQAEDFLKTSLKDPLSYERISCEIMDSVKLS